MKIFSVSKACNACGECILRTALLTEDSNGFAVPAQGHYIQECDLPEAEQVAAQCPVNASTENWEKRRIEIEEYTKENNFLAFFETSAKDGTNLNESIMMLVDYIMKNNIESESSRELNPGVNIADTSNSQKPEKGGCC